MTTETKKYVHILTLVGGFLVVVTLYFVFWADFDEPEPVVPMPNIEEIRERRETAEGFSITREDDDFAALLEKLEVKEDQEQPIPSSEVGKDPFLPRVTE